MSIFSAEGADGNPGILIIVPVIGTKNQCVEIPKLGISTIFVMVYFLLGLYFVYATNDRAAKTITTI